MQVCVEAFFFTVREGNASALPSKEIKQRNDRASDMYSLQDELDHLKLDH